MITLPAMVHLKSVTLLDCAACRGDRSKWNERCGGCGTWLLFATNGFHRWALCNWSTPGSMVRPYIGRPSFTDVHRDLTAAAASGYFTLPGEPDALALQLLRATEPKHNVGRGFAA